MSNTREIRQKRGISLAKLASLIGISKSALSQIENGKTKPSHETTRRINNILAPNIKIDYWKVEEINGIGFVRYKERTKDLPTLVMEYNPNYDKIQELVLTTQASN